MECRKYGDLSVLGFANVIRFYNARAIRYFCRANYRYLNRLKRKLKLKRNEFKKILALLKLFSDELRQGAYEHKHINQIDILAINQTRAGLLTMINQTTSDISDIIKIAEAKIKTQQDNQHIGPISRFMKKIKAPLTYLLIGTTALAAAATFDTAARTTGINPNSGIAWADESGDIVYKTEGYSENVGKNCYALLNEASQAMRNKNYKKAISLTEQCTHTSVGNSNLGLLYEQVGRTDDAMQAYQLAIQINPKNFMAYNNMAMIFKDNKNFSEAIKCFTKSVNINPNNDTAWLNLGSSYVKKGKTEGDKFKYHSEASHAFKQLLTLRPNYKYRDSVLNYINRS